MSPDRRSSGGAPAPETAGLSEDGHDPRHAPRAVSGAETPSEAAAPATPPKHPHGHKREQTASAPSEEHTPVEPALGADGGPDASPIEAEQPADAAQVEVDIEELTAKAQKADEYLDLAQRTKADFENYRKRAIRDAAAAQDRGVARLALELLPAVDNLDRALEAAEAAAPAESADGEASPLISGIKPVHADVIAALARVGIEPFSPKGELFDPQHHEAIAQQPVDGAPSGTVVEVYQRGYRLGDTVLRPARVVVAA